MKNFPSTLCDELEFQNTNNFFVQSTIIYILFSQNKPATSNQSALLLSNVAVGRVGR
jgi:hypothetical protein